MRRMRGARARRGRRAMPPWMRGAREERSPERFGVAHVCVGGVT